MNDPAALDPATHRAIAIQSNGRAWELITRAHDLGDDERDELLNVVHTSAYHWKQVGEAVHQVRAQWLIAKANAELGHGPTALRHAQRCSDLTEAAADGVQDFDWVYASEAMARANALCGDSDQADFHYERAQTAIAAIAKATDRELAAQDLAAGNWGTYRPPTA